MRYWFATVTTRTRVAVHLAQSWARCTATLVLVDAGRGGVALDLFGGVVGHRAGHPPCVGTRLLVLDDDGVGGGLGAQRVRAAGRHHQTQRDENESRSWAREGNEQVSHRADTKRDARTIGPQWDISAPSS